MGGGDSVVSSRLMISLYKCLWQEWVGGDKAMQRGREGSSWLVKCEHVRIVVGTWAGGNRVTRRRRSFTHGVPLSLLSCAL